MWQAKALGVLCVDSHQNTGAFTEDDVQFLTIMAHHMATTLVNHQLQEDLRQHTKLLDRVLTSFSPNIRGEILERARHGQLCSGGKKSDVTILYADIRNFTQMSAGQDAEDVVNILNVYFPILMKTIFAYDGIIDKFIGDAILVVFGSPEPDARQYQKATQAAWEMQAAIHTLNAARKGRGDVICNIGIGIHCGEVLHGFIGTAEQAEFTVIGDTVNRATRYCDGAGAGDIVISPQLYQRVWDMIDEERTVIQTKHEGELPAYRVKNLHTQHNLKEGQITQAGVTVG